MCRSTKRETTPMVDKAPQFECRREMSGTWMVWDLTRNAVASLGGCALRGRTEERARAACEVLIQIYKNRLDARTVRADESEALASAVRDPNDAT